MVVQVRRLILLRCRRTRGDGILSIFNMRLILMEGNGDGGK